MATIGLSLRLCHGLRRAFGDELKLPVDSSDKGTVYVAPNVTSTETSVNNKGATVGVEHPDGSKTFGGMDTSGVRPTYSAGGATRWQDLVLGGGLLGRQGQCRREGWR